MSSRAPFLSVITAVRRRLRWQAALEGAAYAAVLAAASVAVAAYLWRLEVLSRRGLTAWLLAAGGLVLVGALAQALRKIPLPRAAKQLDRSHGLSDRLGSALAFLDERAPTPFMVAAIADATRVAAQVSPRKAAPLRPPRALAASGWATLAAFVIAMLHFPKAGPPPSPPVAHVPHLVVDPELLRPEREAVAQLEAAALEAHDPEGKELAHQLQQLLEQLDDQQLTRKDVFDQLAQIEKKLEAQAGDFEELKQALKKAGAQLEKSSKLTKAAGEALVKEDLEQAKKELEKLAAEAEKLDQQKKEELARALEKTAEEKREKSAQEKQREEREKQLREEERRLKKELAEKPNDRELERRLQRNQRELERLERDKQQRAQQERRLERLERDLQKAAEELRKQLSPEAAEALRRAAQQMGDMQDEIRKLGNAKSAQVQIAELKELLRRAGQSGQGQGQPSGGNGSQQAQNGQPQPGQGQNGKNGKRGQGAEKSLQREFDKRAGGQQVLTLGGDGAGDGPRLLLPLPGDGQGQGGGGEKGGDQKGPGGDGIGDQHDPHVMDAPTHLDSKRKETRVAGKEGAGPSRSETILGSAEKGFASRSYKRVYSDYHSVVEEVMSKERVPPGYRYYVKRYFQLIRPRE